MFPSLPIPVSRSFPYFALSGRASFPRHFPFVSLGFHFRPYTVETGNEAHIGGRLPKRQIWPGASRPCVLPRCKRNRPASGRTARGRGHPLALDQYSFRVPGIKNRQKQVPTGPKLPAMKNAGVPQFKRVPGAERMKRLRRAAGLSSCAFRVLQKRKMALSGAGVRPVPSQ